MDDERIRKLLAKAIEDHDTELRKACLTLLGRRGGSPEAAMTVLMRRGLVGSGKVEPAGVESGEKSVNLADQRMDEMVARLDAAAESGEELVIEYVKPDSGVPQRRRIGGIVVHHDAGKIVCEDLDKRAPRSFRFDRIHAIVESPEAVETPEVAALRGAIASGTKAQIVAAGDAAGLRLDPDDLKAKLISESKKWLAANT